MSYNEYVDHHSDNYRGLEGLYMGMDANDYAIENALRNID